MKLYKQIVRKSEWLELATGHLLRGMSQWGYRCATLRVPARPKDDLMILCITDPLNVKRAGGAHDSNTAPAGAKNGGFHRKRNQACGPENEFIANGEFCERSTKQ